MCSVEEAVQSGASQSEAAQSEAVQSGAVRSRAIQSRLVRSVFEPNDEASTLATLVLLAGGGRFVG